MSYFSRTAPPNKRLTLLYLQMNGVLTLSENIADNGGLRAALRAYQTHKERTGGSRLVLPGLEHFTQEQLFYIGFARVSAISVVSVSLPVSLSLQAPAPS